MRYPISTFPEEGRRCLRNNLPVRFDQIPIQQPFAYHPGHQVLHLLKSVLVADVVPADDLVDVSLQVLRRHGVVGSLVGSLDHGPEAFDAVGVGPIGRELAFRVDDELGFPRPLEILQGTGPVAVEGAVCSQVLPGECPQNVGRLSRNHAGGDLAGFPVLHADDDGFSFHPPFPQPFVSVFVGLLSPYVGLVDLASPASELLLIRPCLPDPVRHEPGRFLRYLEIPVQLHAGHPLETGQVQVDGDDPLLQGDFRTFEDGSGADTEVVSTVATPVGHGPAVRAFSDHPVTAAMRAVDVLAPPGFLEPAFCGRVVGELGEQLDQGYAFPVVPSRSFRYKASSGFRPAAQESLQ